MALWGESRALARAPTQHPAPRNRLSIRHQPAMPYQDLPSLMIRLDGSQAVAARALQFLILTAGRSGEVYGARRTEIDLDRGIWVIPPERMKAGREHRVPLSKQALSIISQLHAFEGASDFLFPGQKLASHLSSSAMEMLLRRMDLGAYTVHGFRSAFRDWAGDETSFPREIAEAALAHNIGDATERAYRRADALERRRKLMQAWADHCCNSHCKIPGAERGAG